MGQNSCMPEEQAVPSAHLVVQFRVTVRNMLPEMLAKLHRRSSGTGPPSEYDRDAAEAERVALELVRTVSLPAVPRIGDEVCANPNWDPVEVERVEWRLDQIPGQEADVIVVLADLDEDDVGEEYGAIELLLDSGWAPHLDQP